MKAKQFTEYNWNTFEAWNYFKKKPTSDFDILKGPSLPL